MSLIQLKHYSTLIERSNLLNRRKILHFPRNLVNQDMVFPFLITKNKEETHEFRKSSPRHTTSASR